MYFYTIKECSMEDFSMISSMVSIVLAFVSITLALVAIWLSIYHHKSSNEVNLITRDILSEIRTQALSDSVLDEYKKNGNVMRSLALADREYDSESNKPKRTDKLKVVPKSEVENINNVHLDFLSSIKDIQSRIGSVSFIELLIHKKPKIPAKEVHSLLRFCFKNGLVEWDSSLNMPGKDEEIRITPYGMEHIDKKK